MKKFLTKFFEGLLVAIVFIFVSFLTGGIMVDGIYLLKDNPEGLNRILTFTLIGVVGGYLVLLNFYRCEDIEKLENKITKLEEEIKTLKNKTIEK